MEHITFILTLESKGNVKAVETFIKDLSVPYTSQCEEPDTKSFEWYFNKEINVATIHETFVDSDAAVLRVENLINSPVTTAANATAAAAAAAAVTSTAAGEEWGVVQRAPQHE